jgi:hypothetical protein
VQVVEVATDQDLVEAMRAPGAEKLKEVGQRETVAAAAKAPEVSAMVVENQVEVVAVLVAAKVLGLLEQVEGGALVQG